MSFAKSPLRRGRNGRAARTRFVEVEMAQGDDVVPIPGTKRRTYLDENAAALEIELTAADLTELALAAPVGRTAGARYPESSMAAVNR